MNPILFDFGILKIYWYSVVLFVAILVGGSIALRESKRFGIPENFMLNLFLYLIPISIFGARAYYVIFNWTYYSKDLIGIFKIWEGGLAIHGGMIAGLIWMVVYTSYYKLKPFLILDFAVVGLIIGQAIGRWGNFFNGEAHGAVTTLANLKKMLLPKFIIDGMYIGGQYYIPTFLFESLLCLIGFGILLFIRRYKYIKVGQITCIYFIWYGIVRFFIESMRTDSLMLGSLRMAQIVSIGMIVIGFLLYFWFNKGSKFDNLYNIEDDSKINRK